MLTLPLEAIDKQEALRYMGCPQNRTKPCGLSWTPASSSFAGRYSPA